MLIPIRCFSCGKPIGHLYEEYLERVGKGENPKKVFEALNLERYCCRGIFLSNIDLIDLVSNFKKG